VTDWISTEEAASISGYHVEHIRRLVRHSKIRAEKKGHDWWIDRADLAAFLERKKESGDSRWGPKARKAVHASQGDQ
jgi:excisionase family DNA binding protein